MHAVASDAIRVFERLGEEAGLSRAWLHVALAHWIRSDCARMESALWQALEHAERANERSTRSRILIDLARTTVIGPRPVDEGRQRSWSLLERAKGDIAATAFIEAMIAVLEAMSGRFDRARERWTAAKRRLSGVGLNVAVIQLYYGFIEFLAGTPERAERELKEACATVDRLRDDGHLSSAAGLAARAMYAQGHYEGCRHYCRVSARAASRDDVVSQVLWRGTDAKLRALNR